MRADKLCKTLAWTACILGCMALTACADPAVSVGREKYPLDTTRLELSGDTLPNVQELARLEQLEVLDLRQMAVTAEEYEKLRAALPDCEILWRIPFQGQVWDMDTRELTITELTPEDLEILGLFPQLQTVDASRCPDLEQLAQLKNRYPQLNVEYQVAVGGQQVKSDAEFLELKDADPAELQQALTFLPEVKTVELLGAVPEEQDMDALIRAFPEIDFLWECTVFGRTVTTDARELDLSGIRISSAEEVERYFPYFPYLERVILCDCGLPSEELDALWKRHSEIRIVWSVDVGFMHLRTDITALMPYKYGYRGSEGGGKLHDADCAELKYLVDLVCIDFGHMWVQDLSFVQYMPKLEYLMLCSNGITDISPLAGLQKLKYLELFTNPITDISALAQCPALEDVNLSYLEISDVTPLLGLKNLKNLWMSSKYTSPENQELLRRTFPEAKLVFHIARSTGFGWRDLPNYFAQRDLLGMPYLKTP